MYEAALYNISVIRWAIIKCWSGTIISCVSLTSACQENTPLSPLLSPSASSSSLVGSVGSSQLSFLQDNFLSATIIVL